MIISVKNSLNIDAPKAFLTFTEVAGTNVLRWSNPNGFSPSWALQVGEVGGEQTEVLILGTATPSGTAGTLTANSLYEHPANTPLYGIKFNQVVFEKSTSGTAGTATPITNGTVTYQADHEVTIFDDTAAVSTDAFRARFRNSVLGSQTSQSDWITPSGFSFYSLAKVRSRSRNKLWNSAFVSDEALDEWTNEWKDTMANSAISVNEDYALGTVDVSFGTAGLGTITTADFSDVRRLWVTYNGVDYFQSSKMGISDFAPGQTFSTAAPFHAWLGGTIFQVKPEESGGTARLVFYQFGTTLVNDTDELPYPMRPYTDSFVDYNLSQALMKDGKLVESQTMLAKAERKRNEFVNNISARDKTGITRVKLEEPLSGQDGWW